MDKTEQILSELSFIERSEGVRVLFACESGSRAWGFASPDSDYDVRFVYVRPVKGYLRLEKTRAVIEWPDMGQMIDDMDIVGWDLCKFLRLMRGSNPAVFEWLGSPIVYREDAHLDLVRRASRDCFLPEKSAHHYTHMAMDNYNEHMRGDSARLKKVLYVIRSILAARHVMKRFSVPPVPFETLADRYLEPEMAPIVDEMLDLKRSSDEDYVFSPESHPEMLEKCQKWVLESLETLNQDVLTIRKHEECRWDDLNDVFWQLLGL